MEKDYFNLLIAQTKKFLKLMRWKILYSQSIEKSKPYSKMFGFKSMNTPLVDNDLKPFEEDMRLLVKSAKFGKHKGNNEFQTKLKKDMCRMKTNKGLIFSADKTKHF